MADSKFYARQGVLEELQDVAFWKLWEASRDQVYKLCLRWMGGDVQEAHDAAGAVMIRAYEAKRSAPATSQSFNAWVIRIARNLCTDLSRNQRRHPHGTLPQDEMRMREGNPSQAENPEMDMLRREQVQHLLQAMGNLPLRIRTPMVMRCIQDKSYSEISRELRMSDAHARKLVQQGRDQLRNKLPLTHKPDSTDQLNPETWLQDLLGDGDYGSEFAPKPRFAALVRLMQQNGTLREEMIFAQERPGRSEQKIISLLRYVDRFGSGWKKRVELAEVYILAGNLDKAIQCLEEVILRQPQSTDIRLQLAHLLQTAGQSSAAASLLYKGLLHTRRPATKCHLLAWISFCEGDFAEGANLMKQAVITEPVERNHLISLARMFLLLGKSYEAWEAARDALRLDPEDMEAAHLAADALRKTGAVILLRGLEDHIRNSMQSQALAAMEISLRLRIRQSATVRTDFELIRKDIRHFGQVSKWSSQWAEVKARYFWIKRKPVRCICFVEQYAAENKNCLDAQMLWVRWAIRLGKFELAASTAEGLLPQFGHDPEWVRLALGAFSAHPAFTHRLDELAAKYPSHISVQLTAAEAFFSLGRAQKAKEICEQLIMAHPGLTQAWLQKAKADNDLNLTESAKEGIRAAWQTSVMQWSPFMAAEAALLMGKISEKESGASAAEEWREMAARIASGEEKNHPALSFHYRSLALSALGDENGAAFWKQKSLKAGIWYPLR